MPTLGYNTVSDIANLSITHYLRGPAVQQSIQDKPLLRKLMQSKKPFGGSGGDSFLIAENIQGTYMSDTAGFRQGYTQDDQIAFAQAGNTKQVQYRWYEVSEALIITESDLKKGGVIVDDQMKDSRNADAEDIVTDIMENRISDFMESHQISKNLELWLDGSQDSKVPPGLFSMILDDGTSGTVGGQSSGTGIRGSSATWFWYNRSRVGGLDYITSTGMNKITSPRGPKITPSKVDRTLCQTLRSEARQLKRFGGKPNVLLAGSQFIEALEYEIEGHGMLTQEGFTNAGKTDFGMAEISLRGLGTFVYDPTLDSLGFSKRCYVFDSNHIKYRPMKGADEKQRAPVRPFNYYVFLHAMQDTYALTCNQRNCNGVYEVA